MQTTKPELPEWMSVPEVAAYLGISHQNLYGMLERGTLAGDSFERGKRKAWRVHRDAVIEYERAREEKPGGQNNGKRKASRQGELATVAC